MKNSVDFLNLIPKKGNGILNLWNNLVTMQTNLYKYGCTVGLEFALVVTVEDELVAEFAVPKK